MSLKTAFLTVVFVITASMAILCLAALAGCASHHGCKDGCCEEGGETAVALADLPPAVRATLDRETAGGKVTEIEREMKDGKTVYSADAQVGGQWWDITIGEDGTLISKAQDAGEEHEKK